MVLTQFFNHFNFISADSVAAVVVKVLAPLKVLTLNAVPESREALPLLRALLPLVLIMAQFWW